MCHIFFIHSCVDGYLDCFHVLAVVNSAAVNIGIHVSFGIRFFSGYMPRTGIAGSYGFFFFLYGCFIFSFLRTSIVAVLIYIPANNVGEFPSLHTLSIYCSWIFFHDSYFEWCEVISHCSFHLHFL